MATKDKAVDAKALMSAIAKGWKLADTPKVRAGFKKGQQKLVQSKDGKTLGMLTMREQGVRVEGSRLAKNVTVADDKGVTEARSLLEAVHSENLAKLAERENRKTAMTAKRVTAAKAKQAGGSGEGSKPSGHRARSRVAAVLGETIA